MDVRGHAGIAQGAEQDGVEIARQHGEAVGGDGGAVLEVAVGAPVEVRELERRAGGGQHLDGFRGDFFADAVAGNDGDLLLRGHGAEP